MPPAPSDFIPSSTFEAAQKNAQNMRKHLENNKISEAEIRRSVDITAKNGENRVDAYTGRVAAEAPTDLAAWTELGLMLGTVRTALARNESLVEIDRLVRQIENAVGAKSARTIAVNTTGALMGLSKQSRGEGGITAIGESAMKGRELPPNVQGMIMERITGENAGQSTAAHLSAAKAVANRPGGPGGQTGPGRRRGKKTRKSRGKKRTTRRR